MTTAEFLVYLLEHETTRDLGRALGEVLELSIDAQPDGGLLVTLTA